MSKNEEEIIGYLPEKRWISAEQLALYLNVNKDTVKRNIERLGIARVVIAGKWLVSIADFEMVARK
ncbi:MAG TPA: hypothetical protein ENG66_08180 [Thermococcus sp.]|nr:hypothetical protein [Thermococcus sp.]